MFKTVTLFLSAHLLLRPENVDLTERDSLIKGLHYQIRALWVQIEFVRRVRARVMVPDEVTGL